MRTLVIRTWEEPGYNDGFRARVTYSDDVQGGSPKTFATADPEEAVSLVRQWLMTKPGAHKKAP
jgi:hypothetical protein